MVVVRRTFRGTHKGEFAGVAASGKEVTWQYGVMVGLTEITRGDKWIIYKPPLMN